MLRAMGRLYLILITFLGMFGCMASSLNRAGSPSASRSFHDYAEERGIGASVRDSRSGEAQPETADDNAIVLNRQGDGHFYADVEVNGTTIEMLVDTGATGVALSEADAHRTGIATTIGMSDQVGEGAGGTVYGNVVKIDRIRLGGTEVDGIDGVVLRGGDMSLLGQDFLRRFDLVEIKGDKMVLR